MTNSNNDNKQTNNVQYFKPTVRITTQLLEDLKNGRETLIPGQWCYSSRDRKKVKYIGTFLKNYDGVVRPVVKFSERRGNQTIKDWNKSFKIARDESLKEELHYRRQLKRQGTINDRKDFTRTTSYKQPQQQQECNKVEQSVSNESKSVRTIIAEKINNLYHFIFT